MESVKKVASVVLISIIIVVFAGCTNGSSNIDTTPGSTYNGVVDEIIKESTLRFGSDGKFKVVFFSDLQENLNVSEEVIELMNKILDKERPDLVVLGGNIFDDSIKSAEDLKSFLDTVVAPMESRDIYWCHVYGTETNKTFASIPREVQKDIYQLYEHCISKFDGDYVLPVLKNNSDEMAYNIWIMDTHSHLNDYIEGLEDQVLLNRSLGSGQNFDTLRFSQVKWYWDTSVALEKHNGKAIPGMMYFHMPLSEFNLIYRNAEVTKMQGKRVEKVSSAELNPGMLWTCYEKGDVKAIFCGHDRSNDFSGTYMDILLGYTSTLGLDSDESTRGARVVQLDQDDENGLTTWMVYVNNLD